MVKTLNPLIGYFRLFVADLLKKREYSNYIRTYILLPKSNSNKRKAKKIKLRKHLGLQLSDINHKITLQLQETPQVSKKKNLN